MSNSRGLRVWSMDRADINAGGHVEFYFGQAGVGAFHDHLPLRVEDTLASACTIPAFLGHEVLR